MNSIRFLVAAYLATWVILGGYLVSIARRYSRLRRQVRELSEHGK
jgi:CcmD family protein